MEEAGPWDNEGYCRSLLRVLDEVRKQIEHWRKTRPHRCRMPEQLWQSAIEYGPGAGMYAVSQGLHISYDRLKAHVEAAGKGRKIKGIQRRCAKRSSSSCCQRWP